jgi:hypothetical protein
MLGKSESEILIDNNEERTECEVWTRVMGYYRPVSAFNKGKQSEYSDRKCFTERQYKKRDGEVPSCPRVQQIVNESR